MGGVTMTTESMNNSITVYNRYQSINQS